MPLSTIIARNRSGCSVRISSGTTLPGIRPAIIGAPVTGVRPETWLNSGANDECRCWPPFFAKLPVRIHSSLFR
ncbi:Uncharacterised protein [Mycobacterium tuberculosis]|uniref:Uncharacterized protein n=1 Tax=Mycobacterium tuberculosis TaxID=1773 RepID=A0A916LEE3_MYCTX|nr:Uncharacterised protein [Mycobacterium tuberculosis]COZ38050.1 Uncharacterised protein [Mycobacterium tuberculosis]CPA27026.1 Uncharacterised protein [Mycobacterium tuberculosis]